MEQNLQTQNSNGAGNGGVRVNEQSRPVRADSLNHVQHNIFNPNLYMLKLPKTKKVKLSNGQVRFEQTEVDYLPVAARIA